MQKIIVNLKITHLVVCIRVWSVWVNVCANHRCVQPANSAGSIESVESARQLYSEISCYVHMQQKTRWIIENSLNIKKLRINWESRERFAMASMRITNQNYDNLAALPMPVCRDNSHFQCAILLSYFLRLNDVCVVYATMRRWRDACLCWRGIIRCFSLPSCRFDVLAGALQFGALFTFLLGSCNIWFMVVVLHSYSKSINCNELKVRNANFFRNCIAIKKILCKLVLSQTWMLRIRNVHKSAVCSWPWHRLAKVKWKQILILANLE